MSPAHSSVLHDEIDRYCRSGDFQEALARTGNLLRDDPLDRTARLYELLINVVLKGPANYEAEVEQLRSHSDLSEAERRIVRKILMVCYDAAEREQDHGRMWSYQRLLRRLVLNQTLDIGLARDEHTGSIKMPDESPRRNGPELDVPREPVAPASVSGPADRLRQLFAYVGARFVGRPGSLIFVLALIAAVVGLVTLRSSSQKSATVERVQPAAAPSAPKSAQLRIAVGVGEFTAKNNNADIDAVSAAKLRQFFEEKLPELKHHYRTRLRDVSGLAGDLTVDLSIDGNGNISKIYESGATMIDFGFKKTLVDEIQKWQFPALHQGTVAVTVVINFDTRPTNEPVPAVESPAKGAPVAR